MREERKGPTVMIFMGILAWSVALAAVYLLLKGSLLNIRLFDVIPGTTVPRICLAGYFLVTAMILSWYLLKTSKAGRSMSICSKGGRYAGRSSSEETNEKLKATLKAMPDLMFEVDRDGVIYDYHAPTHELLYAAPDKFLGKRAAEVLPESAAKIILKAIESAARKGWHRGAVYYLDLPEGRRWFELSISAKGGMACFGTRFIAIARDITARKKTEDTLLEVNSLLSSTIEASFDGILVVDRSGRVRRFNHKFAEMWRIPGPILATYDDKRFLAYVADQLKDAEGFLRGVEALYGKPEAESYDMIEFKDGRIFERYSCPQRLGEDIIGRVWTFRYLAKRGDHTPR